MRLIAVILMLLTPTWVAADKYVEDMTLSQVGPIFVQLHDGTDGGCWTNLMEVSDNEIDSRAVSVLRGAITHVRDGDTFEVSGIPVRISALDCPENSTSSGQKATQFTRQFKGKQAVCELTGAKTYDRVVGYCSIEGKDFAQIMVDNKFCKFWPKYDVWKRY